MVASPAATPTCWAENQEEWFTPMQGTPTGASPAHMPNPGMSPLQVRQCAKCGRRIQGHFVRALGVAFHLECFVCGDCGKQCAAKFFPVEPVKGHPLPLCETCYFKRQNLLCHRCNGSLRGSYITALGRKYHIEHFTCSLCPVVFGPDDSYFEHDDDVYCRYHYGRLYASKCEGCSTGILKQFVETYRGGKQQQWHPECYMIFKFWNVKLVESQNILPPMLSNDPKENPSPEQRLETQKREDKVDALILRVWTTLCGFEEAAAGTVSEMVQAAHKGDYQAAQKMTVELVLSVKALFAAIEGVKFHKEPKTLCRKIVAYMSLISKTRQMISTQRVRQLAPDLLQLASGIAHYLKVLIREGLAHTLASGTLLNFLDTISKKQELNSEVSAFSSDKCQTCGKNVESECFRRKKLIWHNKCFVCTICGSDLAENVSNAGLNESELVCLNCGGKSCNFVPVTRLEQYVGLLHVALARLSLVLQQRARSTPTLQQPAQSPAGVSSPVVSSQASSSEDLKGTTLTAALERTSGALHSKSSVTLDDIRRIVAAEQTRHPRKAVYFGQLNSEKLGWVQEIVHVLLEPTATAEKKATIWSKVGKALVQQSAKKPKEAVFGVPLDTLVDRCGVAHECEGGYDLQIPGFFEDLLNAMRQKDMSMEGIFRKNGNIRKLRETIESVDKSPNSPAQLADETPVQLAALLKRFLRELPDPLLGGSRLTKIWLSTAQMDLNRRIRTVQLLVCMLPKPKRDLLEVLVTFLSWVSLFAHVDEEAGSKMDLHNLATVIAPNILLAEDSAPELASAAIVPVELMLEQHSLVSQVPSDIVEVLEKAERLKAERKVERLSPKDVVELARNSNVIPTG